MGGKATPIVKWAGGKRQLLDELAARVPEEFNTYHEFFLGGGALFFELYNTDRIDRAYLSDSNPRLMNLYEMVKRKPYEVIEELKHGHYENEKTAYYKLRANEPKDKVKSAAWLLYLNKTAFNGLYRENSKKIFNVPFGNYKNPKILNEDTLLAASEALSRAKLLCGDFSEITKHAKRNDFAYFDPPYYPINGTSNFTSYTSAQFGSEDQRRLKDVFESLEKSGVKVLLSNSSTGFITELYSTKIQETVMAKRMINCIAEKRGDVKEVLIMGDYL